MFGVVVVVAKAPHFQLFVDSDQTSNVSLRISKMHENPEHRFII